MRPFLVFIVAVIVSCTVDAQVSINLNFNIDRQPVWGPAGYDYVEYYYLPDIEVYYNVPQHRYFYYEGGHWIGRSYLPPRYRGFDLYHSYKVVVNEPTPYRNHVALRDKYASFKGHHGQQPIRDARDSKYYANPNHPEHTNWVKQQKHENGNGKGNGRDNNSGKMKRKNK